VSERTGPREGLILLVFAVLAFGASTYVVVSTERDLRDDPAEKAARGEIDGLDELSLLREENLRRVLDEVESGKRPLVINLRVSAPAADVTVRDADGSQKVLNFDPGFDSDERDLGTSESAAFRPGQIDAGTPELMARRVAKRTGQDVDAVDYVTISASSSSPPNWYLALNEGPARDRQWVAAMDGSDLRKPGEPSAQQRARTKCFEEADGSEDVSRCIERFDR